MFYEQENKYASLSDVEIKNLLANGELTLEQRSGLTKELESRQEGKSLEREHQVKVKSYGSINKPRNGYVDVLVLSLITFTYGVGILLYIVLNSGM